MKRESPNASRSTRRRPRHSSSSGRRGWVGDPRQPERKRTALAWAAFDSEIAAQTAGEITADREAQAHSLPRPRETLIDLHERLEDQHELVRRDADTRVGHRNPDRIVVRRAGRPNVSAWLRELDGVRQQVE